MTTHNDFYSIYPVNTLTIVPSKSTYGNYAIHVSRAQTLFFMRKKQAVEYLADVQAGKIIIKPAVNLN